MKKEKIEEILNKIEDEEQKKRLLILYNGYVTAQKAYMSAPSTRRLKDMESATEALNAMINDLAGDGNQQTLPNILAVVDYLTRSGWKIKKSSAYKAVKEGKLRRKSTGTFLIADAERYAALYLRRLDGNDLDDAQTDALQRDKLRAEARKSLLQADLLEIKKQIAEGNYVPKDTFERELSYRAMVFKMDGDSFCRSEAGAIIELVGGDKDKIPDLQEFLLEKFHKWLSRYAADKEFIVPQPTTAEMVADDQDEENSEIVDGE
jgi:hypothetical protein